MAKWPPVLKVRNPKVVMVIIEAPFLCYSRHDGKAYGAGLSRFGAGKLC